MSERKLAPTFFIRGEIHLGWMDRLRALLGRTVRVRVRLDTEIPDYAGGCESHLEAWVDPVFPRRAPPPMGTPAETDEERVARAVMDGGA